MGSAGVVVVGVCVGGATLLSRSVLTLQMTTLGSKMSEV